MKKVTLHGQLLEQRGRYITYFNSRGPGADPNQKNYYESSIIGQDTFKSCANSACDTSHFKIHFQFIIIISRQSPISSNHLYSWELQWNNQFLVIIHRSSTWIFLMSSKPNHSLLGQRIPCQEIVK